MLGDLLTAICDGDLSMSLALSALAFSKTWKRDFTLRLESSSSPRSGLSEAEIQRTRLPLTSPPRAVVPVQTFRYLSLFFFFFGGKSVRLSLERDSRGEKITIAYNTQILKKAWRTREKFR